MMRSTTSTLTALYNLFPSVPALLEPNLTVFPVSNHEELRVQRPGEVVHRDELRWALYHQPRLQFSFERM
jgi:hypothetical protein